MKGIAKKDKILIVEDEKAMLDALVDNFRANGFKNISVARNGENGLEMALRDLPDLIVLDIVLPKMDGITVFQKIRSDSGSKKINILILTNLILTRSVTEAIEADKITRYLIKTEHSIDDVMDTARDMLSVRS